MIFSIALLLTLESVRSFTTNHALFGRPQSSYATTSSATALDAQVGIFFGTSTGSTEEVAYMIQEAFGDVTVDPIAVDDILGSVAAEFDKHDALVLGTPTWNTGADTERSGTGWDEIYYGEMQELKNLATKKVAVFGLGDQISYAENYADATGELHDVLTTLGCNMLGQTSMEGYEHEDSKAIRGDKFCGLLCDAVNQSEMSEKRVKDWVKQLLAEGILETGGAATVAEPAAVKSVAIPDPVEKIEVAETVEITASESSTGNEALSKLESENAKLRQLLEENSLLLESAMKSSPSSPLTPAGGTDGFTPNYNPKTQKTMWTAADGRTCYYTTEITKTISDAPDFRP